MSIMVDALNKVSQQCGPADQSWNWRFRRLLDEHGFVLHEWRKPPEQPDETWMYAPRCVHAPGAWVTAAWLEMAPTR